MEETMSDENPSAASARRWQAMQALRATAAACICFGAAQPGFAQGKGPDYPVKPVQVVVGFSAGSTNDASARAISARLTEALGQQFLVVNREGAAGSVGGAAVAKARPDGYTLLWASSANMVTGPVFHGNFPYDPVKDFSPISVLCYLPYVIVVNPSVPAQNPKELIELARREPDKLAYASTGVGGTLHLAIELMQHMGKIKMTHVPYKGTPAIIVDLVAGRIQVAVMSVNLVVPQIKAGKMRGIAITSNQRTDLLPDVPTMDESGLKGYDVRGFYGLVAPANTPPAVLAIIHGAFVKGLEHPEVKAMIAREGARAGGEPPAQFARFLKSEADFYRKLIADANLRASSQADAK